MVAQGTLRNLGFLRIKLKTNSHLKYAGSAKALEKRKIELNI